MYKEAYNAGLEYVLTKKSNTIWPSWGNRWKDKSYLEKGPASSKPSPNTGDAYQAFENKSVTPKPAPSPNTGTALASSSNIPSPSTSGKSSGGSLSPAMQSYIQSVKGN